MKFNRDKNCTAIWEAFSVVLDKDPCSVLPSDYDLFINLSWHSIPRDKVTPQTSFFFADYEIPYFQKKKITRFEIWVMHEIGGPNVPVKLLKCVDHSTHPDCALNSAATSTQREIPSLSVAQSATLMILVLVVWPQMLK
ncbi:ADP-ribosyl cyclase/cyclic ADP-ribose hydrolase 2 [Orycteropus afer afer]|uniref:ADP-ribosyl cyclase/cyclic ADP-ribose hydrolase n=1 Tax=Orycteropus afer afer TaxID=1230840 RepID=A0A8B7AJU0_ORYAF|nr:ADP-ribosyl cyclase/cyclic ADP-ribose hydrolase 2 [Orycteropus afer afer]